MSRQFGLILLLVCLGLPLAAFSAGTDSLRVRTDRADCLYSLGDTVLFRVELPAGNIHSRLSYRFSADDARTLEQGVLENPSSGLILRGTLDCPGFLRLDLRLYRGSDTLRAATSAGFDLCSIQPVGSRPKDWRMFWAQGLSEVARVEMDPRVERWREQPAAGVTRYRVSLANVEGSRIWGWLSVPDGAGPFPGVVYIQGAPGGLDEYQTDPFEGYARRGMVVLAINPHGLELGREVSYYQALMERGVPAWGPSQGADDPYRYYFRRVVLGAVRAVDYLCSRTDVDTSRIAVSGASQGGGLSLLTAAVDRRIRAVTVHVPAMCDYSGALVQRPTGWPHLIPEEEPDPRVIRTAGYFDAALAAGNIRVPAFFTVSYLDQSCPPTTVYAAFNSLRGPKEIVGFPNTTHPGSFVPENDSLLVHKLEDIFKRQKK